ncbi:MAG: hypothetical protein ABSG94_11850 [Brevinematales bacterium]|jgi:hypothetical protein
MSLTNLILSYVFALEIQSGSSFNQEPEIISINHNISEENRTFGDEDIARALDYVQSFDLVYQDMFIYTMPGLGTQYSAGGRFYTAGEGNPVANMFFKNNLWDMAFISANAFNFYMFNNRYLSAIYAIALDVAEVWAISTWQPTTARQINVSAIIYEQMF